MVAADEKTTTHLSRVIVSCQCPCHTPTSAAFFSQMEPSIIPRQGSLRSTPSSSASSR
jgi:hypothetical protein